MSAMKTSVAKRTAVKEWKMKADASILLVEVFALLVVVD